MKTTILKINPRNIDANKINIAAKALREGKLVAFPTETVYGLGVNALDHEAVDKLYKIKKRPRNKPLTYHIADTKTLKKFIGAWPAIAEEMIGKFWPGPLTILLPSDSGEKIGFRMPHNKIALTLIRKSGVPVFAPSANISGRKPPTSAKEVLSQLDGKIDILIDAGKCDIGVESTILDLTQSPPQVIREGAIHQQIKQLI